MAANSQPTRAVMDWAKPYIQPMAKSEKDWYTELELWSKNPEKKKEVPVLLEQAFQSFPNPYVSTMILIELCTGYPSPHKQTTLPTTILSTFQKWIQSNRESYATRLDDVIRQEVFHMFSQNKIMINLFNSAAKAYELRNGSERFVLQIQQFIRDHRYHEAAICVSSLSLHQYFDFDDIVVPLLLQNKVHLIQLYITDSEQDQIRVLKLLDQLCDRNFSTKDYVARFEVPDVNWDFLTYKPLSKLAIKLMKMFKINAEVCPYIHYGKTLGAIRYFLHQRYDPPNSMSYEVWKELVEDAVGDNRDLKRTLIEELLYYQDLDEAARFARYYKLSDHEIPAQVVTRMRETRPAQSTKDRVQDQEYHTLSLPRSRVKIVETKSELHHMLDALTQAGDHVGIDAEWRPVVKIGPSNKVNMMSILQLATKNHVHLLDIQKLLSTLEDEDWCRLASEIFANENLVKLGYGIATDFHALGESVPATKPILAKTCKVIDLQKLAQFVLQKEPEFFTKEAPMDTENTSTELTPTSSGATPNRESVPIVHSPKRTESCRRRTDTVSVEDSKDEWPFRIGKSYK